MNNAEWCMKQGIDFASLELHPAPHDPKSLEVWNAGASMLVGHIDECDVPPHFDDYRTILWWLDDEREVLDAAERRYLLGVIRPFWKCVQTIVKEKGCDTERIEIRCERKAGFIQVKHTVVLPPFVEGLMYKGMKAGKEYPLAELGLLETLMEKKDA